MENVRRVDLSSNELTRFPGARVGQELHFLEVLVLNNNLLHVLEDVSALAAAPRLCELDVRDNPLRLCHNRLYLLETLLFHEASVEEDILRELHWDEDLKSFVSASQPSRNILYRSRLPRRRGFPMLQMLNGDWVTDSETRQVEVEGGKAVEYFRSLGRGSKKSKVDTRKTSSANGIKVNQRRFDGSRMTIKQMLRNEARITAIPPRQVLKHYQIDTESCEEVSDSLVQPEKNRIDDDNDEEDNKHQLLQRLFRPLSLSPDTPEQEQEDAPDIKPATGSSDTEPWNYPVSTFDDLHSDERQYVRYKSKHVGGTLERDDHFFESTTFLDCVAQCERSRRLTIRAVDLLTQRHADTSTLPNNLHSSRQSQSSHPLPMSEAAAVLTDNLSANFTKRQAREGFERVADFQQRQVTVGDCRIQAAVGDYLLGEHIALRQKTNQLLSGQAASDIRWRDNAHGIEASLEESLSKVKLRNAVDLANTLGGGKEQKRLIQALIDADAKVIEEERVMEEHKSHRQRLRRINARQVVHPQTRREVDLAKKLARLHEESPWQERNWRAKMKLLERKREEIDLTEPIPVHSFASSGRGTRLPHNRTEAHSKPAATTAKSSEDTPPRQVMAKFRTIETVEKAARDPLVRVDSHDLLVRCSEIRQNKDKHVKALAIHRDRFLDEESEWERMRQDPINLVRRHLRRELFQDVQPVQIGTTDYFYSPIFQ
ncbi:uncharacterized protein KRP23_7266 [Phytophthora ramorum]|uniref:uncharacterized protein n=1 Tax=Phytophthora ramorum TaxID=164328 RepID=UPI0030B223B6|nr:hypothetical protein KRP23_7266 [Phytophthora ramorum]